MPAVFLSASPIDRAFNRLYSFDFAGAHRALDEHAASHPGDALGYSVRAAAYLFSELDRLMILEAEFFLDNSRIAEKKKLRPDLVLRQNLLDAVETSRRMAGEVLANDPRNTTALFALCMNTGILTDYTAFVEKRQLKSLSHAKESQSLAVRLLEIDASFYDAYLTTGLSEYIVGSLPFLLRWFVRFEQTRGNKHEAVANLERVARSGRYLGPFARILLAVIHLRENRPGETEELLRGLTREFPENPLFRNELTKLQKIRAN